MIWAVYFCRCEYLERTQIFQSDLWLSLITVVLSHSLSLSLSLFLKTGTICVWCSISAWTSVTLIRVLDRYTWHIQSFLTLFPAHRRFIEKNLAKFVAQPLLLPTSWRQLIICPLNLIHFLVAKLLNVIFCSYREHQDHLQAPTSTSSFKPIQSLWKISRSIHLLMLS